MIYVKREKEWLRWRRKAGKDHKQIVEEDNHKP